MKFDSSKRAARTGESPEPFLLGGVRRSAFPVAHSRREGPVRGLPVVLTVGRTRVGDDPRCRRAEERAPSRVHAPACIAIDVPFRKSSEFERKSLEMIEEGKKQVRSNVSMLRFVTLDVTKRNMLQGANHE